MKKTKENNEENKGRSISSPLSLGEGSGVRLLGIRLFSSYFTFLSRNKVYTAINVFGLSLSLMFVMLIGVYVWQGYRVDKQHSKAERIYTLGIDMGGDEKVIGISRQVAP